MTTKHESILSVIGNTPLVRLHRAVEDSTFKVFAKWEALNPGGSIKDRPALKIVEHGFETGEINADTVIVESSSGNMGIGLAQVCRYFGLHFICVVDAKTTNQNRKLLEAYGAELDLISEPDPTTGEYLQARIARVRFIVATTKNAFWPNQYSNLYNSYSHRQTMEEIATALDSNIDYLFCSTSTCGTLRGCAEYLREQQMKTKVVAVDAVGSVIFGGPSGKRLIPGHGAAIRPELCRPGLADQCVHVSDFESVVGCRRLVNREAMLAGGSSGATLMALEHIRNEIPDGAVCVLIFPDRGERYLDTIYSDEWVVKNFGGHALEHTIKEEACQTAIF